MRTIFVLILIALLLGVGVVAVIETDPGYLLVSYGNYTLESSLWVGLLLLVLVTVLIYALIGFIRKLLGSQQSMAGWLKARRARLAARRTTRGLISFIEGNWSPARRQLLQGARGNEAPLLNYLMAARASDHLGEGGKSAEYLSAAGDSDPAAAVAVALTQAEMQLHGGQYRQALDTLKEIRGRAGRSPRVVSLLRSAYVGLADWDSLAGLLPELKRHRLLSADELARLELEVHTQRLRHSVQGTSGAGLEELRSAWQQLPTAVKQDPATVRLYAGLLIEQQDHAAAEKIILRSLKQQWDSALVRLYGYVCSENIARQLTQAESWLAEHADDAQLLLSLGRIAARDKLWGKARDYFEGSYRLECSAETCAELGRLLNALGEPKVAAAYYREGLMLQQSALPELPMPAKMLPDSHRLAHS